MKAFPRGDGTHSSIADDKGMDLRDYFAAKAMQTLIPLLANQADISNGDERRKEVSMLAYKQADEMMIAREKK